MLIGGEIDMLLLLRIMSSFVFFDMFVLFIVLNVMLVVIVLLLIMVIEKWLLLFSWLLIVMLSVVEIDVFECVVLNVLYLDLL